MCALAQELVRAGRPALYSPCSLLVQELLLAKRELKLPRLLKRLAGYDVLVVDDLGYVQQNREEMEVLFTLLAERYERGSVLLTSNLAFSGWESIFKDAMTTAAAIDRLVHHCVILELNIASYRAEQAKKSKDPNPFVKFNAVIDDNYSSPLATIRFPHEPARPATIRFPHGQPRRRGPCGV